jgi:hypothetical protein
LFHFQTYALTKLRRSYTGNATGEKLKMTEYLKGCTHMNGVKGDVGKIEVDRIVSTETIGKAFKVPYIMDKGAISRIYSLYVAEHTYTKLTTSCL